MIHTIHNPKLVDYFYDFKNKRNFTGVVNDKYNNIVYFLNGQYHRTDGPAFQWSDGDRWWCLNGKQHRIDGPAIESSDGTKEWWLNGKRHCEEGPAVTAMNSYKEWHLNGNIYGYNDEFNITSWKKFIKLLLLK